MCPPPPQASSRTGCRSPDFGLLHWMVWSDVTINSRETSGPAKFSALTGKRTNPQSRLERTLRKNKVGFFLHLTGSSSFNKLVT